MVRTKADGGARKAVAAKAPRKVLGSNTASSAGSSMMSPKAGGKYAGGNSACERPTPDWQKDISKFFMQKENTNPDPVDQDEDMDVCETSTVAGSTSGSGSSSKKDKSSGSASGASSGASQETPASTQDSDPDSSDSPPQSPKATKAKTRVVRNNVIESDSDDE